MPEVKYAEPNYAIHLCAARRPNSATIRNSPGTVTLQTKSNISSSHGFDEQAIPHLEIDNFLLNIEYFNDLSAGFGPNDPLLNYQWYLNNTGQIYKTSAGTFTNGTSGVDIGWLASYEAGELPTNEIIIAVIDTGTDYTHVDITNRMWRNTDEIINGIDDDFSGEKY